MMGLTKVLAVSFFCFFSCNFAVSGEIAPGISVKIQRWHVPVNENPFFGFIEKNQKEREADVQFLEYADKNKKDRQSAANELIDIAWKEILNNGDLALASRRLNQAWLLDRDQSQIAHGFALISLLRFKDISYALEMMYAAEKMKYRRDEFYKHFGWILNLMDKPKEAIPHLENSIQMRPLWSQAYVELARSHVMLKDYVKACPIIEFLKSRMPKAAPAVVNALNKEAACK